MRRMKHFQKQVGLFLVCGLISLSTVWAMEPSHMEHSHSAGTWMFELKAMHMKMDGLRHGTNDVSLAKATSSKNMGNENQDHMNHKMTARETMNHMEGDDDDHGDGGLGYMMAPTDMTMDMLMLMPMYNFTSRLSGMVMVNYLRNEMNMENNQGGTMKMKSEGQGDTQASLSYKFADDHLAASLGVGIPTGSIDEKGTVMGRRNSQLPYAMQLGSGSYDVISAMTYLDGMYDWNWGSQFKLTYRTDENDNDYRLGHQAEAVAWIRRPLGRFSVFGELSYKKWGAIHGADPKIKKMMTMPDGMSMKSTPTADPTNSGGELALATLGASTFLGPVTLGLEITTPFMQDFNGVQMKQDLSGAVSVTAMF